MRIIRYLADIFVDTFGITRPSADLRDRAARYIAFLILLLLILLTGGIVGVLHYS